MKELMFEKVLTLTNQINKKNVCFIIIIILRLLVSNFNHMLLMAVMIYQ